MLANDKFFAERDGLPMLLETISQKACKIAFLGNSVTAQRNGYRTYLSNLINQQSKNQHVYINAGIGGVGSLASVFFVNDFVLRHKPDICFVECTVADVEGATPAHYILPSIHGIVNKLQSQNIFICFFHLFNSNKGILEVNQIVSIYDDILAQYGIPSINIYKAFSSLVEFEKNTNHDLVFDGVHTTDLGAELTAKFIFQAVLQICEYSPKKKRLKKESSPSNSKLEFTEIIKPDLWALDTSKIYLRNKFKGIISYIDIQKNEFICFKIKQGTLYGILLVVDKYSGVICINYGSNEILVQTFDNWCDKERLQVLIFEDPLHTNTEITVSLSDCDSAGRGANLLSNTHVKKGQSAKIVGFLTALNERPTETKYLW
jgi:hypothetical protein